MGFRSLTEQMDTTTPQGAFLFSVFGALAQYERALARERIMAGLESARKRERRAGVRGRSIPRSWRRSTRLLRMVQARPRCAATLE